MYHGNFRASARLAGILSKARTTFKPSGSQDATLRARDAPQAGVFRRVVALTHRSPRWLSIAKRPASSFVRRFARAHAPAAHRSRARHLNPPALHSALPPTCTYRRPSSFCNWDRAAARIAEASVSVLGHLARSSRKQQEGGKAGRREVRDWRFARFAPRRPP